MRWGFVFVTMIAALLFSILPVTAAELQAQPVWIAVNDELLTFPDAQPELRGGTTYVPVRFVAEAMQADLTWVPVTSLVTIYKDGRHITLDTANGILKTDLGEQHRVDLYTQDQRLMAPTRLMSESLGYQVSYIASGPISRIKDDSAKLTDEELAAKFKARIDKEKAKWEAEHPAQQPVPEAPKPDKVVYLTFDDGPNAYTEQILNTLKEQGVTATFFVLGPQIEQHKDLAKRMIDESYSVGLHGMTHDSKKIYRSPQTVVQEMEDCNKILTQATGFRTAIMRVPYGSKPWMPQNYRDATVNAGYHMWDWNVDSYDSKSSTRTADETYTEITNQVSGKKNAIVLLHDKKTTADALPKIIKWLKDNGYAFERIYGSTPPVNFWNDQR
ncbi:polysaccharide deacetylase family protein [Tumebacillus permanentifrigoris]|uniref:Peptidoglycan/xylan/chitin deacetylase (PgdA/CDA1 family) n=1 Tax=Tumebacillus permanentifrigoris TaxID=378543 RepID=A0A316DG05_9BACL|nr:polysaccharide deacetylase family protein [Tumebacillus permanentifrigoris]PWK16548.1 peptidoglycan/xylan/chitin deacetylase (PgdA/CDA1 family) [Tumebacillus permanentifrigoris]